MIRAIGGSAPVIASGIVPPPPDTGIVTPELHTVGGTLPTSASLSEIWNENVAVAS